LAATALPGRAAAWYPQFVVQRFPERFFHDLTLEQFGIDRLSPEQRVELSSASSGTVSPTPPSLPDWHLRELERRITAADADSNAAEPWEAVLARLAGKP
jgi:hypothetical protein